jgi:hypothetical protein
MLACRRDLASPEVADGEDSFQIWRIDANVLKESLRAEKMWPCSLGIRQGLGLTLWNYLSYGIWTCDLEDGMQEVYNTGSLITAASELARYRLY